ncbi:MAG: hypothetical protein QM764_08520 [Chitinophagaceae bacterium]
MPGLLYHFKRQVKWNDARFSNLNYLDRNKKCISNRVVQSPTINGALQPLFMEGDIFYHGHDVCVDEDHNVYVCQWNAHKHTR